MQPITYDFKSIRKNRQQDNDTKVYNGIQTGEIDLSNINKSALERICELLGKKKEELFNRYDIDDFHQLQDDFHQLLAMCLSKKSSRQGSKDEKIQLEVCNEISRQYGIYIENLPNDSLRPTKDGVILSKKKMTVLGITKDNCLKSFDGKISGNINGYISAKVSYGGGGHQDNVFGEMDDLSNWWKTYKSDMDEILIVLIDTDLITKLNILKKKYDNVKNIMICNHIEFQQYIIDIYQMIDTSI